MVKKKSSFICMSCEFESPQWLGNCPRCKEWNSFEEFHGEISKKKRETSSSSKPVKIKEIKSDQLLRLQSGIEEFDQTFGGGVVTGSLILLGGEPGVGKSTLLSKVVGEISKNNGDLKVLYVSGEESCSQIAQRMIRIGVDGNQYSLLNETNWEEIRKVINESKPKILVLDSIQTTFTEDVSSAPGTVSQIREVTYKLMNEIKSQDITCFVVGHITKDGNIAGPKVLEHMVDTVAYFEGEKGSNVRIMHVKKNRFGDSREIGLFQLGKSGIAEIKDPSKFFVKGSDEQAVGRSITCYTEGSKTLFFEIQSLVIDNKYNQGKRTSVGYEVNRLSMMIAIIEKNLKVPLCESDVFLNVVGGLKVKSRDSDLAVVASVISSHLEKSLPSSTVFLGEVGLSGEVRDVQDINTKIKDLAKFGYKRLVVSKDSASEIKGPSNLEIIPIEKAHELKEFISTSA